MDLQSLIYIVIHIVGRHRKAHKCVSGNSLCGVSFVTPHVARRYPLIFIIVIIISCHDEEAMCIATRWTYTIYNMASKQRSVASRDSDIYIYIYSSQLSWVVQMVFLSPSPSSAAPPQSTSPAPRTINRYKNWLERRGSKTVSTKAYMGCGRPDLAMQQRRQEEWWSPRPHLIKCQSHIIERLRCGFCLPSIMSSPKQKDEFQILIPKNRNKKEVEKRTNQRWIKIIIKENEIELIKQKYA